MTRRYVALLRGVNLAGKNRVPMRELADIFVDAGCVDVLTYIQSGNVVFSATTEVVGTVAEVVTARVGKQMGHSPAVVLRSAAEMLTITQNNPFVRASIPETELYMLFLMHEPSPENLATLDYQRSAPDEFDLVGRNVYMHLPNGGATTRLTTAYFDSRLKTTSTARNWRTVTKLAGLVNAIEIQE